MSRPPTVGDKKIIRKDKEKKLASSALFSSTMSVVDSRGAVRPSLVGCAKIRDAGSQWSAFLFPSLLYLACENQTPSLGLAFLPVQSGGLAEGFSHARNYAIRRHSW